jgi:hypothetical protein
MRLEADSGLPAGRGISRRQPLGAAGGRLEREAERPFGRCIRGDKRGMVGQFQ